MHQFYRFSLHLYEQLVGYACGETWDEAERRARRFLGFARLR